MKNKIFSNRALFNFLGRFPHLRFRPGRFLCKQFYELLIPFRVTVGVMVVVEEEEERELWEGDKRGGDLYWFEMVNGTGTRLCG